jgi:uncharacterized protein
MTDGTLIYKNLSEDELVRKIGTYLVSKDVTLFSHIMRQIYSKTDVSPFSYEGYLFDLIMSSENEFSLKCEKSGRRALENTYLTEIVKKDMDIIRDLFKASPRFNMFDKRSGDISVRFTESTSDELLRYLADEYYINGCGPLHRSAAYIWNNGIDAVRMPDKVNFDSLIGYEYHKRKIINNTNAFIHGKPYNNILLFGDRGTGKSSCVKAAFNMFKNQRIRIVELSKSSVEQIQDAMEYMGSRGFKFILFLDDLSFEENEYGYKELKAHLEGGLECQPDNVVIYATSNRFHIVREAASDNADVSDEMHLSDAIQEKLSLSDRFGITITFDTPSPKDYINIVKELLAREGIDIEPETMKRLACRWEISNHGRSGRSASQFVRSVAGSIDDDVRY